MNGNEKERKSLTMDATTENLYQALGFVDEQLEQMECSPAVQMRIDLVVEELFVNVAHYAYAPETGSVTISIETEGNSKAVVISMEDSGVPYDPLAKEDPDVTLAAQDRQIGGLGIFMIKKNVDDIHYERKDGKNILTFKKFI